MKLFPLFLLLINVFSGYCQGINGFVIDRRGGFSKAGSTFSLVRFNKNWWGLESNERSFDIQERTSLHSPEKIFYQAFWATGKETVFQVQENVTPLDSNGIRYAMQLKTESDEPDNGICFRTFYPVAEFAERTFRFGEKKFLPSELFLNGKRAESFWGKDVELPLTGGVLQIKSLHPFSVRLQDNRVYKKDQFELRIVFRRSRDRKSADLDLNIRWHPFSHKPLSLQPVANMGFADSIENDGKGGWTDQGPENDLRAMKQTKLEAEGIPFAILNPGENNGKSCLVLRGKARPSFPAEAEIVLRDSCRARYLYLLHAVAWESEGASVGNVTVETDGEFVEKEIVSQEIVCGRNVANFWNPRWLPEATVAWQAQNGSAKVGLYISAIPLTGNVIRKVRFSSKGNCVWMIVGATFSDCPPVRKKEKQITIQADNNHIPVSRKVRTIKKGSILDFSFLLDAPAGKYGFARPVNGRFEFEKRPGKAVRFYGINYGWPPGKDREMTKRSLEEYAASGYNLLRLHHFDRSLVDSKTKNSLNRNPLIQDRLDFLLAEAARLGIYITLDLFTMRIPFPDEIRGYKNPPQGSEYKALIFVSDPVMENFEEYARGFMNHVNPYTGLAWKEDPAIIGVSLINEDTIYAVTRNLSPRAKALYDQAFERWCENRKIKPSLKERPRLWRQFLFELYEKRWKRLRKLCQEIGIRQAVTDQNFWNTYPVVLHRNQYDYADSHFYAWHPIAAKKNGSPFRPPLRTISRSVISRGGGGLFPLTPARLLNKPFWVSEWDFCGGNQFNVEGSFLMGAYSSAQDYTALMRFCGGEGFGVLSHKRRIGIFFNGSDPMLSLGERAGALLFLRGDVSVSRKVYPVLINREMASSENANYPRRTELLALLGRSGTIICDSNIPQLPRGTVAAVDLRSQTSQSELPIFEKNDYVKKLNLERNEFMNDTGELHFDSLNNCFRAITPRSESFVLPAGKRLAGNFMEVENRKTYGAYFIAAMDQDPLNSSERFLLLHLTHCRNSGQTFRNKEMEVIESWGELPVLALRGTGKISLHRDLSGFSIYPLNFNGERLEPIPFTVKNGRTEFTVDTEFKGYAVGAYEIIRQ